MILINSLKQIPFLKSVKRLIVLNNRKIADFLSVKWLRTLYFNFKMFGFKTAIKLPVFFYGKVKFNSLKGEIKITAPLKRGMVKFGYNLEIIKKAIGVSELKIDGILIVNGSFVIGIDAIVIVQKGGILEIGENSHLGSRTRTVVTKKVSLGRYFRLSQESQILDSSFHYMLDTETNEVKRFDGEIIMNDYCWVGNRSSIMKNTITPRYTTVASNSLLNKDYSKEIPEKSVIGGVPARLLKKNMSRIYNAEKEAIVDNFFRSHPEEIIYRATPGSLI